MVCPIEIGKSRGLTMHGTLSWASVERNHMRGACARGLNMFPFANAVLGVQTSMKAGNFSLSFSASFFSLLSEAPYISCISRDLTWQAGLEECNSRDPRCLVCHVLYMLTKTGWGHETRPHGSDERRPELPVPASQAPTSTFECSSRFGE